MLRHRFKITKFFLCLFLSSTLYCANGFDQGPSVQDYYSLMKLAYEDKDWVALFNFCEVVIEEFPDTPFSDEARFYLAVGYYNVNDYSTANQALSDYLKNSDTPKHFEEAIQYKFQIAENYRKGALRRMFYLKKSPKIAPAKEDALEIYEEVISSFPYHDLTARSLYGKGLIHRDFEEFREAVETFQLLIKRFPKHETAIDAFIEVAKTYVVQCKHKNLNPELIALAELNLKRFKEQFPSEQRIHEVEDLLLQTEEYFAKSLYETGKFFERRKKNDAAIIYYKKILASFPNTPTAQLCQERLSKLQPL